MFGSYGKVLLGLVALGSIGVGGAAAASAAPAGQAQGWSPSAARSFPHAQAWKAECWWIDDHRIGVKRWGTTNGTGETRVGAVQDARDDVPDGAAVFKCATGE